MCKILSFGEILWDMLPGGKKLGGAPANFAYHCGQLGGDVRLLSQVGKDALGKEILEQCRSKGIFTELIGVTASFPTGTVSVQLGTDGLPSYTIHENTAWDFLPASPAAIQWATQTDVLCFGTLAARSEQNRSTLKTLLDAVSPDCLRVADINLREPFTQTEMIEQVLSWANVLKLNDDELVRLTDIYGLSSLALEKQLQIILARLSFRLIILTCGEKGSWLITERETVFTPSIAVEVVDTVGAGDAFAAVVVLDFLKRKPLHDIGQRASEVAAYVCTQSGAMPKLAEPKT